MKYVKWFDELSKDDVTVAGGKGANLAEMANAGFPVPEGFVVIKDAYDKFLEENKLKEKIFEILKKTNIKDTAELTKAAEKIQNLILSASMPKDIEKEIREAYRKLCKVKKGIIIAGEEHEEFVAVRSSATAEDLPTASFAGQQKTLLNVKGEDDVVNAVKECWASLFTPRAIFYREEKGFKHEEVSIAVVVQRMINADKAGVMFTVNPATSDKSKIVIEGAYGLGEAVVSGQVTPDTYVVNKETLEIEEREISTQEWMITRKGEKTVRVEVPEDIRSKQKLDDSEIVELARYGKKIEEHYNFPQDIEWAVEGDKIYILQSRPVTTLEEKVKEMKEEEVEAKGEVILKGLAASPGVAVGKVKIIHDTSELHKVEKGDILVTKMTTPDMVPAMERAAAIVTNDGGLTCVEGDAKVLTDRGFLRMREVYELVKCGKKLKVLGLNAKTLKTEWKEVIDAQKREAKRFEIVVYRKNKGNKDTIKITPDHNFPIFLNGVLSKVKLADILSNNLSVLSIDRIPIIEDRYKDLAMVMYLGGAILSDGHIVRRDGKPIRVRFTQKYADNKKEFIEKIKEDIRIIGGEFLEIGNRNNVIEYQTSRKRPSEILGFIEENINTIPLYASENELVNLIAGFVDGDGCLSGRRRIEIYQNSSQVKKIEGIILSLYRLGIIPRLRYKKATIADIYFKNNLETILQRTKRIRLDKLEELEGPIEGEKLIDISQILPEAKDFDYRGYLYNFYKRKSFIGIDKLERYFSKVNREGVEKIKEKIKLLKQSDVYSIRIGKVGEDYGEVYNITVEASNEFNHNYIVWTKNYTPIVVFNCHAAIVSRELGIPCVVGTKKATQVLKEGEIITVDATRGIIYRGEVEVEEAKKAEEVAAAGAPIITATAVKVNIDMPRLAEKAAATGAEGVGLLRAEHMILELGKHPRKFIEEGKEEELVEALANGIEKVCAAFYPYSVWYRTLDAPTGEFRRLEGGENEPEEPNPMLGWRGIRRGLDEPWLIKAEFKAIKKVIERGYNNIGVMLPLVQHVNELRKAKKLAKEVGLIPHKDCAFGIMVETPAAALCIEDFIKEGIDFISFGTNDLTQYTLAVDRDNARVAHLYNEAHPAVWKLIEYVIKKCKEAGVETSICGQAGSYPSFVEKLVELGIDSVSANIDAVQRIKRVVARVEQRIMLEAARELNRKKKE